MSKMRFGIFMPPFNSPPTQNPTTSLQRDVETIQLLDRLGFDEAWIGEHHSAATEIIADPLTFIAHVGALTRDIKLGTGVVSIPYHNPLWVADRAILVDHLLRGRLMLGVGPGSLPTDAAMIGLEPAQLRPALHEDLDVLLRLLLTEEPVSVTTDRYTLVDARCQLAPYQDPCFEVAVAATASPTGPTLAGKYGLGMLSVGATTKEGFDVLGHHWNVLEAEAAAAGRTPDRSRWRLMGPMHIAETREKAMENVKFGFERYLDYLNNNQPRFIVPPGQDAREWFVENKFGVIGTPDDAIELIERLYAKQGEFGAFLHQAHNWADWEATKRSYELYARYVMPRFSGENRPRIESFDWCTEHRDELTEKRSNAARAMFDKHETEQRAREAAAVARPAKGREAW